MSVLWSKVGEGSREERRAAGPEMVLSPWGLSLLTSLNSVPGTVPEAQQCGHDPDKGPACSPGGDLPNGEEATRNRQTVGPFQAEVSAVQEITPNAECLPESVGGGWWVGSITQCS